ncbi:MAG: ABC transporter ATP-binding protein [Chloroflexi bacterium]|nr:ABC transporter ATP-binding protein [Chloroflexota bacterium]
MRQVAGLLAPRHALLAFIVILVIVSASLELAPPLILRNIVDDHLMVGRADGLIVLALLFLGASAAVEATRAYAGYLTGVAAQGTLHDLRVRLFAHFQALPIRWFDRTPLGEAIAHCTSDIEAIQTLFTSGVASLVIDLARVVTISIALVTLSPPLAGIAALTIPPLLFLTRRLQREVREAERRNRAATGQQGAQLQETFVGAETIQTFARQDVFVHRLRLTLKETLMASNRATLCSALYTPNVTILAAIAGAGLLWIGARGGLAEWDISLGTLTAFVLLLQRAFAPIASLGEQWQTVQGALAGVERVFTVLAEPEDLAVTAALTGQPGEALTGLPQRAGPSADTPAGALDHVTFGYSEGLPIVHSLSMAIQPGEHVALVGRTGAGKTSALSLLGGLYEPWSGSVTVLGRNPRELHPNERRRLFGVVPQTALLFNGTVIENVALFDPSVTPEMIGKAIQLAGAEAFVAGLPHGEQTLLAGVGGGRGMRLSAGQTALLALARAIVWDPPLILLDEATAAIDAATEAQLSSALRAGVVGNRRGLLTVAHRLATAREADRVIVLEGGRIVEEGPPAELIRRGGRFATLVELEAAGWDWREA